MCINLQVYFALQLKRAVLPETVKTVSYFLLYDSAQNIAHHLRASSPVSFSPRWCASRVHAQPCNAPHLVPKGHYPNLQRNHREDLRTRPCSGNAVLHLHRSVQAGVQALVPQHCPPPRLSLRGIAEHPQSMSCQWYIFTLWNSNLSMSYWPLAAWVLNYEVSLMVFEM